MLTSNTSGFLSERLPALGEVWGSYGARLRGSDANTLLRGAAAGSREQKAAARFPPLPLNEFAGAV